MPPTLRRPHHAIGTAAAKICTGTKMLAFRTQNDRAHLRRAVIHLERIGDFGDHVGVDEVVRPTPHLDRGDEARFRYRDVFVCSVAHGCFLALLFQRVTSRASLPGAVRRDNDTLQRRDGTSEETLTLLRRNGSNIHHEAHGSGASILLTHGFGATSRMWDEQIEEFTDRYRLILWDLPAHCESESPR